MVTLRTGLLFVLAIAAAGCGPATWLRDAVRTRVDSPAIYAPTVCETVGSPCCRPDYSVPSKHCGKSVGCNVDTGKCEACGKPGQVCCDGPYTGFSLKGYKGILLDPTERIESCDPGAVCDAKLAADGRTWLGTRRCVGCGTREGGACCPPDPRYGLGRCFEEATTGARLACDDPWARERGKCVRCGFIGRPVCRTGGEPPCDPGSTEKDDVCVACGKPGQPGCDLNTGDTCDRSMAVYDWKHDLCVAAGGKDQPCLQRMPNQCQPGYLYCDENKICRECGNPGQACCPGVRFCWGRCIGTPQGDRCVDCGREGQHCCEYDGCNAGLACRGGTCRPAAGGGGGAQPPEEWKTCNGKPATWSVKTVDVWIEGANGCLWVQKVRANSPEEALECARNVHGEAVVADPQQFEWSVDCPTTGCTNLPFVGRDEDGADQCAQSQFVTCEVNHEQCP